MRTPAATSHLRPTARIPSMGRSPGRARELRPLHRHPPADAAPRRHQLRPPIGSSSRNPSVATARRTRSRCWLSSCNRGCALSCWKRSTMVGPSASTTLRHCSARSCARAAHLKQPEIGRRQVVLRRHRPPPVPRRRRQPRGRPEQLRSGHRASQDSSVRSFGSRSRRGTAR